MTIEKTLYKNNGQYLITIKNKTMKIEFKNIGGIWYCLINEGTPQRYHELSDSEKEFFNQFIKEFKTH